MNAHARNQDATPRERPARPMTMHVLYPATRIGALGRREHDPRKRYVGIGRTNEAGTVLLGEAVISGGTTIGNAVHGARYRTNAFPIPGLCRIEMRSGR